MTRSSEPAFATMPDGVGASGAGGISLESLHKQCPGQAAAYGGYSMYTTSEFWRSLLLLHSSRLGELHLARVGATGRAHLGDRALARLGVHNRGSAGDSVCRLAHVRRRQRHGQCHTTGPRGAPVCYGIAYTPDPSLVLRGVLARCTAMALCTYPCGDQRGSRSSQQCSPRHQRRGAHHPC